MGLALTCSRCGGILFHDRESAVELARYGYLGARVRCSQGCTDRWIMTRAADAVDACAPDPRGRYARDPRMVACRRCSTRFVTTATNTKWCASCKAMLGRERARAYERRRRRAAA